MDKILFAGFIVFLTYQFYKSWKKYKANAYWRKKRAEEEDRIFTNSSDHFPYKYVAAIFNLIGIVFCMITQFKYHNEFILYGAGLCLFATVLYTAQIELLYDRLRRCIYKLEDLGENWKP